MNVSTFSPSGLVQRRSTIAPWLAVLVGLLVTGGLFWKARLDAYERFRIGFKADASVRADIIMTAFKERLSDLDALRRFYNGSSEVERHEFWAFVGPGTGTRAGLQAMLWIPMVPQTERARVEAEGRKAGWAGFQFRERDPQGRLVAAAARAVHYPAFFVEPAAGNETVPGFDYGSDTLCLRAMEQARDTGTEAATPRLPAVHAPGGEPAFLVFMPVYKKQIPLDTVAARRAALEGYVAALLHPKDIVQAAIEPTPPMGLPVNLLDRSAPADQQLFYQWKPRLLASAGGFDSPWNGLRFDKSLPLAGREWLLEVRASKAYRQTRRSSAYWLVLPLGLLLSGLAGFYLRTLLSRHQRTEQLVHERTAALEERETTLEAITSSAQDAIIMVDPDGCVSFWNPAAERILGWTRAEALGRKPEELLAAAGGVVEARKAFLDLRSIMRGEALGETLELPVLRKDRREVPIELSLSSVTLHGRAHAVGILRDISERRQAQAQLDQAERRYHELLNNLTVGVYRNTSDDGGRFLEANPTLVTMFEAGTKEELLRHHVSELYPDPAQRQKFVEKLTRLGAVAGEELELRTLKGRLFWASISATMKRDEQGAVFFDGVVEDISQRRLAEESLQRERILLRTLIDHLPDAVYVKDDQGRKVLANLADVQNMGRQTEAEVLGKSDFELFPKEVAAGFFADDQEVIRSGQPVQQREEYFLNAQGEQRWLLTSKLPLRNERGEIVGLVGIGRDITLRKRAEESAQHERILLRTLIDNLPDGIFVKDAQGRKTLSNPADVRQMGARSETEVLGKTDFDLYSKDIAARFWADDQAVLLSAQPVLNREEYYYNAQGEQCWLLTSKLPFRNERGQVVGLLGIAHDITLRKRAEEAAQRERILLRTLIDHLPDAVYVKDRACRKTVANRADLHNIGRPTEADVLGKTDFDLFPQETAARFYADDQTVIRTGQPVLHREEFFYDAKGEQRWLLTSKIPLRDERNEIIGLVGVGHDITQRKRAEERLRLLSRTIEQCPASILITDPRGCIEYANPKFTEVTGYTLEEVRGQTPRFLKGGMTSPEEYAQLWRTIAAGHEWTGVFCNRRKDGSLFWEAASISPVTDPYGRTTHYVAVKEDITILKRATEELRVAKEAAEAANRAKSEFLANMSHEIRTPMNGVIGMTGLLLDTPLRPEQREYAETIRASGETLLTLINDVLDFSKIEAGQLELEVLDFDLREVVEDTSEILALRAQQKHLEFICLIEPQVPMLLQGDPGRVRQILLNLAGNAIKFTPRGEVSIHVTLESETETQATLRFEITDTGIGIPADKLNRLFTAFSQVDASTTRRYGGTGLGLSISKRLVAIMGGSIGVESQPGQGSKFWFKLTFEIPSAEARLSWRAANDLVGRRILVVDDNATNRRLITLLLKAWGCEFEEAAEGGAALDRLSAAVAGQRPFDLALLDMHMPGMDGEELGRRIKGDSTLASLPLVMLTSLCERGEAARLKEAGFAGHLTKPLRQSQLYHCICVALGRQTALPECALSAPPEAPALGEGPRRKFRILLAEDNITNQRLALVLLEKMGYRADAVANGREALHSLCQIPYDLVLMDCQMPEMDGYEAARAIRDPQSKVLARGLPIIALTACAMQGDREVCLQAGMNDYLTKPMRPKELAEVLERWLGTSSSASEPASEAPAPADPISSGVFDESVLLASLMGDSSMAGGICESFIREATRQITGLQEAVNTGDAVGVAQRAHSLKGSSANLGAPLLRATAAELERLAREGQMAQAGLLLSELRERFAQVRAALERFVSGGNA